MNRMRILLYPMTVLLAVAAFAAPAPSGEKPVFGFCVIGLRHSYFRDMTDEMEKRAEKAGVAMRVVDADFNLDRQRQSLEEFIKSGVSAILVAPVDSKAIVPTLQKAKDAGIPVMTVDVAASGFIPICHCASDNVAGGRLAAGILLEKLYEKNVRRGTILLVDHTSVTSTAQRVKGFADVITLRGNMFELKILDAGGLEDNAARLVAAELDRPGANVIGVFGCSGGMTLGALAAVERAGRLGSVPIVGYDYVERAKQAIDEGKIVGNVVQFPRKIGAAAFDVAHDYVAGKNRTPPKEILVEVGTYTSEGFFDQRGNVIDMTN